MTPQANTVLLSELPDDSSAQQKCVAWVAVVVSACVRRADSLRL